MRYRPTEVAWARASSEERERAAAQGIAVDQLEDFYRQRNLLATRIVPADVVSKLRSRLDKTPTVEAAAS